MDHWLWNRTDRLPEGFTFPKERALKNKKTQEKVLEAKKSVGKYRHVGY